MDKIEFENLRKELIEKIDICDYIGRYTNLKYDGKEWVGICPFHNGDTDPSLHISREKKRFYCFGCNKGGSVVEATMLIKGVNQLDAVEYLANNFNIKPPEKKPEILLYTSTFKPRTKNEEKRLFLVENCMEEYPDSHKIKEWIDEGISEKVLEKYDVRYSLDKSKIIFPIWDRFGNIISLKYRNLNNKPKYKYTNKLYKKDFLYNLNFAEEYIIGTSECVLFESEKSVMKAETWGIHNTLAVGSHCLSDEIELLIKCPFDNLIFAYDSDVKKEEIYKQIKLLKHYKNIYITSTKGIGEKEAPCDRGFEKWMELYNSRFRVK